MDNIEDDLRRYIRSKISETSYYVDQMDNLHDLLEEEYSVEDDTLMKKDQVQIKISDDISSIDQLFNDNVFNDIDSIYLDESIKGYEDSLKMLEEMKRMSDDITNIFETNIKNNTLIDISDPEIKNINILGGSYYALSDSIIDVMKKYNGKAEQSNFNKLYKHYLHNKFSNADTDNISDSVMDDIIYNYSVKSSLRFTNNLSYFFYNMMDGNNTYIDMIMLIKDYSEEDQSKLIIRLYNRYVKEFATPGVNPFSNIFTDNEYINHDINSYATPFQRNTIAHNISEFNNGVISHLKSLKDLDKERRAKLIDDIRLNTYDPRAKRGDMTFRDSIEFFENLYNTDAVYKDAVDKKRENVLVKEEASKADIKDTNMRYFLLYHLRSGLCTFREFSLYTSLLNHVFETEMIYSKKEFVDLLFGDKGLSMASERRTEGEFSRVEILNSALGHDSYYKSMMEYALSMKHMESKLI